MKPGKADVAPPAYGTEPTVPAPSTPKPADFNAGYATKLLEEGEFMSPERLAGNE